MTNGNIGQHISGLFNKEMADVHQKVLVMGGLVEQQIELALLAFSSGDMEMAERVIHQDREVNAMETAIDQECLRIFALRQPAAFDLRFLLAVIKIIHELERIGDKAKQIAKAAVGLAVDQRRFPDYELKHMTELVKSMLVDALNSFARMTLDDVLCITQRDKNVDREYESILRQLMTHMMEDSRHITRMMDMLWTVRALERIGDHACYICGHLVYAVKGEYVNAMDSQQLEQRLNPAYKGLYTQH